MKVSLIDFTGKGHMDPADYAAGILIFTKSTRLNMTPGLLDEVLAMSHEDKVKELTYMANTVPSSWEFCDYTFLIEGVTRAFTHQLVRTRTASYAQQAMRVLNVSEGKGWAYDVGPTIAIDPGRLETYTEAMEDIDRAYAMLIREGAAVQDARGLLPTNILTNICMKINMRNLVDLIRKRSSARVQDEYRSVIMEMKERILEVHPWTAIFIDRTVDKVSMELQEAIGKLPIPEAERTNMVKLLDQIRSQT